MRKHPVVFVASLCFLLLHPFLKTSFGEEADAKLLLKNRFTLQGLIAIGFERNPKLKSEKVRWRATIERFPQVTAFEDPEIGIDTWNIPTDFALDETRNTIYWISQKFPFPGKLEIKGEIVSKEIKKAKFQYERATRDVIADLKESYFELCYLDQSIKIVQQNKALAAKLAQISATEHSKNVTTLNDVLKAQAQLGQLDNDLVLLRELRIAQIAHINSLLDFPPSQAMGSPRNLVFLPFHWELNQLYEMARQHQQELKIHGIEIEKFEKGVELAEKEYSPDFRLTMKWFENNGIQQNQGLGVLFGVKVPIWFEKNNARVQQAKNNLKAVKFEKKNRENETFSRINQVYFKIKNSERLVKLYKESLIPQSLKSLEIAESWYRDRKGTYSSLLEARSVWLNFSLAYQRALTDYFQNQSQLEKLLGVGLKSSIRKETK